MHGHNEFPFSPFFQALSGSGIKVTLDDYGRLSRVLRCDGDWDIDKLRDVLEALLTKSPEEGKLFRRCFDDFFLAELSQSSQEQRQRDIDRPIPSKSAPRVARKNYFNYVDYIVLTIVAIGVIVLALNFVDWVGQRFFNRKGEPGPVIQNTNISHVASPSPSLIPEVTTTTPKVSPSPINQSAIPFPWRSFAVVGATLILMGVLYLLRRIFGFSLLSIFMRPSTVSKQSHRGEGPRGFSLGVNRGEHVRCLSEKALDRIANSIRYAVNEMQTRKLDVKRSVAASARNGGLMSLVHQKRKELSEVGVLVDAYAQPLLWNTVTQELGLGLSRRGVTVASGRFFGKLNHFRMDDGTLISFEDLEEMRDALMLFIFSDGKHLDSRGDKYILESLVKFRTAAWFDLREPQFWDESTSLVARSRMPLFQANEKGLLRAVDYFLNEQGKQNSEAVYADQKWRGVPAFVSGDLDSYLEQLLGDALPWAQICSVMKPLPVKFANALREKFQPHLPQERIERLFRLPGTWFDTAGLHFSRNTLSALRKGFSVRWDKSEQSEVLQFVIGAIEAEEPSDKESLSHLAWEWTLQRVRLDLEPDAALRQIARLSHGPLGPHIREEMAQVLNSFDFDISNQDMNQPLLVLPKTRTGKRIMAQFRDSEPLDSEFRIRVGEWTSRTQSLWLRRLVIGFFRGFVEYLTTTGEFLIYFPYPAGGRDISGYGVRNL